MTFVQLIYVVIFVNQQKIIFIVGPLTILKMCLKNVAFSVHLQ